MASFLHLLTCTLLLKSFLCLLLFNGFEIRDLIFTNNFLSAEIGYWNVPGTGNKIETCGTLQFLGGSTVFKYNGDMIFRQYTNLPSHSTIYFSLNIIMTGTWGDPSFSQGFRFEFDNLPTKPQLFFWDTFSNYFHPIGCGIGSPGLPDMAFWAMIPHSGPTLTLKLTYVNPNGATGTFGIRDISMLFSSETTSYGSNWASNTFLVPSGYPCIFPLNYYDGSNCHSCNPSCSICFGPGSNQCIRCNAGYYFDGTNCIQCHPSCYTCHGPQDSDCHWCALPLYFINGYCDFCNTPLIRTSPDNVLGICSQTCPDYEYMYDNGGCSLECDSRFTAVTNNIGKFCRYPCPAGAMLYSNTSCSTTPCVYPMIEAVYGAYKICQYLCPANQMAFKSNSTCIPDTTCSPPYGIVTYGIQQSCEVACPTSTYTYWNGTCQDFCPSRMVTVTIDNMLVCNPPRCGSQQCDRCGWDGIELSICKPYYFCSDYYGRFCIPYYDYVLQTESIKPILNGYILRARVSPTTNGLVPGINDTLSFKINGLTEGLDYTVAIKKVSLGNFLLTVQFLRELEITSMTAEFTYSPNTLDLFDTLALERTIFIDNGVERASSQTSGSSQIMFLFFMFNIFGMIFSGGLTALWTALPESQYSYYLLYLNVGFPHNTQVYLESMNNYDLLVSSGNNGNDTTFMDPAYKESLPNKFFVLNYPPDFYENVDQVIIQLIITIGGLLVAHLLTKFIRFPRELSFIRKLLDFLIDIFKWNGIWRQLLVYVLPLSTAAMIQIYLSIFQGDSRIFAVIGASTALVIMSIALAKMISLIRYSPTERHEKVAYNKLYGTLWADLTDNSFTSYYFWFVSVRSVLLAYVSVFLDMYPYIQIFAVLLYQLAIVLLFFKGWRFRIRPVFTMRDLNFVTMLQEVFLLFMKLLILVFQFMREDAKDSTLIVLGWLIVLPGVSSQVLQIGYSITKQLQNRRKLYQKVGLLWNSILRKKKKKRIRRVQRAKIPSSTHIKFVRNTAEDPIIIL